MPNTRIIAISGGSGSGKSLFTRTLITEILDAGMDIRVLCEDHYYRDQTHLSMDERLLTNYDHPAAFEHELLLSHLEQLKTGQSIDYPEYCFKTHTRLPQTQKVEPASVIIVEGIMLLASPELLPLFDIKVFIDTPLDICLLRRINRDMQERGRSLQSITEQYESTVKPMYHRFVAPSRFTADVIVTQGGKNRIALDVLKSHIQQVLK
ncbi:uridine kinase [Aliiglaciecola sp. CAU 1673]|uniref:uridine kinase n=1 Tax=Aliiglaciecola sp. CAU 1673 TaxID=3032595 RepID=UPI0023DC9309|nr:uridine kinase [Aliiglaciecola sp. CAU 1673]MDF2176761.1 uridine kinase [Aliiglaciecola sp. CAU 1673]